MINICLRILNLTLIKTIDCFTHNQENYFASSKINENTDIRKQYSLRKIDNSICISVRVE